MPAPMPRLAPVTRATLPSQLLAIGVTQAGDQKLDRGVVKRRVEGLPGADPERAFEHHEENHLEAVRRGVEVEVRAELAGADPRTQDLDSALARAGATLEETLAVTGEDDLGILPKDRLEDGTGSGELDGTADLGLESSRRAQGRVFEGCGVVDEPVVESRLEHCVDQRVLVSEMLVDERARDTGGSGDVLDGRSLQALLRETRTGGLQDARGLGAEGCRGSGAAG